jgi:hypothetical protein
VEQPGCPRHANLIKITEPKRRPVTQAMATERVVGTNGRGVVVGDNLEALGQEAEGLEGWGAD